MGQIREDLLLLTLLFLSTHDEEQMHQHPSTLLSSISLLNDIMEAIIYNLVPVTLTCGFIYIFALSYQTWKRLQHQQFHEDLFDDTFDSGGIRITQVITSKTTTTCLSQVVKKERRKYNGLQSILPRASTSSNIYQHDFTSNNVKDDERQQRRGHHLFQEAKSQVRLDLKTTQKRYQNHYYTQTYDYDHHPCNINEYRLPNVPNYITICH